MNKSYMIFPKMFFYVYSIFAKLTEDFISVIILKNLTMVLIHWSPQMPHTFSTATTVCCPQGADSHYYSGQRELHWVSHQPQIDN